MSNESSQGATTLTVLDRSALAMAGQALFGVRWQTDLANALNVGDRRVREWLSGDRRIPTGVWSDIGKLLADRASAMQEISTQISALASGMPNISFKADGFAAA